ncbi:MAG: TetR/AcrR family transcriptional regulator [Clostridia bacterium]|nr:TetR/AcrR family transcriptional regulator [Clostridia bacterium]
MKKENRSVQRICEMLRRAYAKLILEKDAKKITVIDVADRAGLSRSTFYLHYEDINALKENVKANFEDRFNKCVDDASIDTLKVTPADILERFEQFFSESEDMCKWLLRTPHYADFLERMKKVFTKSICLSLERNGVPCTAEAAMLPYWLSACMSELYTRYLQEDVACTLQQINKKLLRLYHAEMEK